MKLAETARADLESFEDTIASIMDGTVCNDYATQLQSTCMRIKVDAQIAMALYPEGNTRCLNLYYGRISRCLFSIRDIERMVEDEERLKQLGMVYLRLYNLAEFMRDLWMEELDK